MTDPQQQNKGHGHVVPRPDGVRARCGGPALCKVCQQEVAAPSAPVQQQALPPLPKVGAIGYASAVGIQSYSQYLHIGPHLPGVRDVALWTTDQMRAYAAEAVARALAASAPSDDKLWAAREADHGCYPESGTLANRLRWWIPLDAKHGKTSLEIDLDEAANALESAPSREAPKLPNPGSPEASAMIDSMLAKYHWPSNPKNAARAGYEAARQMLSSPSVAAEGFNPLDHEQMK